MKKRIVFRSDCPISTALDIIGDKWSLLIIRDLLFKEMNTYGEFLNGGENISTNILADRLALLECGGIITREEHPDSRAKVLYKLTPKGIDLAPMLVEMIAWSEKHHKVHQQAVEFAKAIKKDKVAVIGEVMRRLR